MDLCSKGYTELNDELLYKYLAAFPVNTSEITDVNLAKLYEKAKSSKRKINRLYLVMIYPKFHTYEHNSSLEFKSLKLNLKIITFKLLKLIKIASSRICTNP